MRRGDGSQGPNVNAAPFVPVAAQAKGGEQSLEAKLKTSLSLAAKTFTPSSPSKSTAGAKESVTFSAAAVEFRPTAGHKAPNLAQAASAAVFVPGGAQTAPVGQASQPTAPWMEDSGPASAPIPTMRPHGTGAFIPRSSTGQPVAAVPPPSVPPGNPPAGPGGRGGRGPGRGEALGARGRGRGRGGGHMISPSPFLAGAGRAQFASQFVDENLRQELQQRRVLAHAQMLPDELTQAGIAGEVVEGFHSFWPLEDLSAAEEGPSTSLGIYSVVLKAVSSVDGLPYALRRVNGRQVVPSQEMAQVGAQITERWRPLGQHPGLVVPRHVLITSDRDAVPSLVFVHDLHGGATSLEAAHMRPVSDPATGAIVRHTPSEQQIWSYATQLAAALHAAHSHGLPVRPGCLDPSKVLLTVMGRVRIGSLGVLDVLRGEAPPPPGPQQAHLFSQDLAALGHLLLALMCAGTVQTPSVEFAAQHFTRELVMLAVNLMEGPGERGINSAEQLVTAMAGRMCVEFGAVGVGLDRVLADLERELENGRMARLLVKLGFVTSRPPSDLGMRVEAGDLYLAGLLRDFLFGQVSDQGAPAMEWGHVIEALGKLDAGVPERVTTIPRDERTLVVASYAQLRRAVEGCYHSLMQAAAAGRRRMDTASSHGYS